MELDIKKIEKIIPHRYPFLMIDRVINFKPNQKLVAIKNFSINEDCFLNCPSEQKYIPEIFIIEAMAQAACIYFYYSQNKIGKKLIYYLAKTVINFEDLLSFGQQLYVEVSTLKLTDTIGFVKTMSHVKSKLIAEGEIIFSIKEL